VYSGYLAHEHFENHPLASPYRDFLPFCQYKTVCVLLFKAELRNGFFKYKVGPLAGGVNLERPEAV